MTIKKGGAFDIVAKAFMLFLLGAAITASVLPAFAGENLELEYKSATERVQHFEQALELAETNLCTVESELASEKLAEHYAREIELTSDDVLRLAEKAKWACGEVF